MKSKSMYYSYLYKYIIILVLCTFIYMAYIFIWHINTIIGITYEMLVFIILGLAKIYMDNYNNKYIEENFVELFNKHKSKLYDYRKNLLSFQIFLDIRKNKIEVSHESDLYKVAKEGFYFAVFECIGFIITFINFLFISI